MKIKIHLSIKCGVTFAEAFALARRCEAVTFDWRGNKYHTKTAEELGLPQPPKNYLRDNRICSVNKIP